MGRAAAPTKARQDRPGHALARGSGAGVWAGGAASHRESGGWRRGGGWGSLRVPRERDRERGGDRKPHGGSEGPSRDHSWAAGMDTGVLGCPRHAGELPAVRKCLLRAARGGAGRGAGGALGADVGLPNSTWCPESVTAPPEPRPPPVTRGASPRPSQSSPALGLPRSRAHEEFMRRRRRPLLSHGPCPRPPPGPRRPPLTKASGPRPSLPPGAGDGPARDLDSALPPLRGAQVPSPLLTRTHPREPVRQTPGH